MVKTKTQTKTKTKTNENDKMDMTSVMKTLNQNKANKQEVEKELKKQKRLEKEKQERDEGAKVFKKLSKKEKRELKGMAQHLGSLRKLELSMVVNQASFLKKCKKKCADKKIPFRFFIEVLFPKISDTTMSLSTATRRIALLKDAEAFEKVYGKGSLKQINTIQQMKELLEEANKKHIEKADEDFSGLFKGGDDDESEEEEEDGDDDDESEEEEEETKTDTENEPSPKTKKPSKPSKPEEEEEETKTDTENEPEKEEEETKTDTENEPEKEKSPKTKPKSKPKGKSKVRTPKADETMASASNPPNPPNPPNDDNDENESSSSEQEEEEEEKENVDNPISPTTKSQRRKNKARNLIRTNIDRLLKSVETFLEENEIETGRYLQTRNLLQKCLKNWNEGIHLEDEEQREEENENAKKKVFKENTLKTEKVGKIERKCEINTDSEDERTENEDTEGDHTTTDEENEDDSASTSEADINIKIPQGDGGSSEGLSDSESSEYHYEPIKFWYLKADGKNMIKTLKFTNMREIMESNIFEHSIESITFEPDERNKFEFFFDGLHWETNEKIGNNKALKKLLPVLPEKFENLYHQNVLIVRIGNNKDWSEMNISPNNFKRIMKPFFEKLKINENRKMFEELKKQKSKNIQFLTYNAENDELEEVETPLAFRQMLNRVNEKVAKQQVRASEGYAQCPNCDKKYKLKEEWKTSDVAIERERWLSGCCSDSCWDEMTGWNKNHPDHPDYESSDEEEDE